jgi:hypothetical protein
MKAKIQKLLDKGVKIVTISKDSRVRHLPTVERTSRGNFQGKIVIADPIEFAEEDIIDRDVVTTPPYIWL